MGYRSDVYFKTTTEGWLMLKRFNDTLPKPEQPLDCADEIIKTPKGFYKIQFWGIKWYNGVYKVVNNFITAMDLLKEENIPFTFIRIGEDVDDTEKEYNWTDDMPSELIDFEVRREVYDPDGDYETV